MKSVPFWLVVLIVPILAFLGESTVSSNVYHDSSNLLQSLEDEAGIVADVTHGYVPMEVAFALSQSKGSESEFVNYLWNFGDGAIAGGLVATHHFSSPGEYRVSLTVIDNKADAVVFATTVSVSPRDVSLDK